jgi:hypothetical protein
MSLPESLERAASELAPLADKIRPANGDPMRLLELLDADESGRMLKWLLDEETASAEELVQAWCETDAGAAVVLGLDDRGLGKAGRKCLRKARHRLRSQGIEAPEPERAESAPRRSGTTDDRWQSATVSAPDFRGARVGYLVESHPAGGARLFEVRFDEGRGILDFKVYNAGRSKVRGFLRSLTEGQGQRLLEVDRDALRALVRRASLAQPIDRPLPTHFVEWRARLFPDTLDTAATPGDLARRALAGEAGATAAELEAALADVREGRLGPWPPKTTWVGAWMERARSAVESLDGEARAEAIERWIDEAGESLQKETETALLARHLDEAAWVRWRSGEEAAARGLLAVADSITRDDAAARRLARARVEGLFAPFLTELRVVEDDAGAREATD